MEKLKETMPIWIGCCTRTGTILGIILTLVICKVIRKFYCFILAGFLIGAYFYRPGFDIKQHGSLNFIVLNISLWGFLLLFFFCRFLYRTLKSNERKLICIILVISTLSASFYFWRIYESCQHWTDGIGGKQLINDDNNCIIPTPNYCSLVIRSGFMDYNQFVPPCSKSKTVFNFEITNQRIASRKASVKQIGFPRIEKEYNSQILTSKYKASVFTKEDIFDMDDPDISQKWKDNTEYIIDVTDPNDHKLSINIKANKTRAEEQKKLHEKIISEEKANGTYKNRIDKNKLIIYLDNVSRAHFIRKMPKTVEWLSQFVDNVKSEYSTYQFFRYQSIYFNTANSNSGLYYGVTREVDDAGSNIMEEYSKNGYITAFAPDTCNYEFANFYSSKVENLHRYDHYGGTIACEPNYSIYDGNSKITWFKGPSSEIRRCMYGDTLHNVLINYVKEFWKAYPDNRKFVRTHFGEGHEKTGELLSSMDDDIVQFLQWFHEMGYMEDTFITFLSDHGAHGIVARLPFLPDDSRHAENVLPLLVHVSKDDIPENAKKYLVENEQSFISSLDVFSSLKSLAGNKKFETPYDNTYAYWMEKIPKLHDCDGKSYFYNCVCYRSMEDYNKKYEGHSLFHTDV